MIATNRRSTIFQTRSKLTAPDGSGWEALASYANEESVSPFAAVPNAMCAPAGPLFNVQDFELHGAVDRVGLWQLGIHLAAEC